EAAALNGKDRNWRRRGLSRPFIRFPQDCFALRGNAMARKPSMSRADFRASGIRIPNDSFGIRISQSLAKNPP
ncbi:hypothetical protein, partial [Rhodoblastus sp.]|uniref:hypothetical protein n=1 Tax=Rhodoblastus sp. TaxID=1962975 RepID=UPI003FD72DE6